MKVRAIDSLMIIVTQFYRNIIAKYNCQKSMRHSYIFSFVVAPSDMEVPFVKKPVHHYSDRSEAPEWLRDAEKKLETCDGFVFLCPEINRSIPPALSNMIDYFGTNIYIGKPSAIITYSTG